MPFEIHSLVQDAYDIDAGGGWPEEGDMGPNPEFAVSLPHVPDIHRCRRILGQSFQFAPEFAQILVRLIDAPTNQGIVLDLPQVDFGFGRENQPVHSLRPVFLAAMKASISSPADGPEFSPSINACRNSASFM